MTQWSCRTTGGGPIGLSWAVAHPERISGLFILNTYAHGPRGKVRLTRRLERDLEEHFRAKPVRIMWGMRDVAFTPKMLDELWLRTFPAAEVTRLEDAGHFVPEDAHERVVPELLRFLARPADRVSF
jgi:pimeloyl-ACP methyl ester carboxylesterase